jgi:DNA invertase Pin-like site-specific DNA recombinase
MSPQQPKIFEGKLARAIRTDFDAAQKERENIRDEMKAGFDGARKERRTFRDETFNRLDEILRIVQRVDQEMKFLRGETVKRLEKDIEINRETLTTQQREITTLKQQLHLS